METMEAMDIDRMLDECKISDPDLAQLKSAREEAAAALQAAHAALDAAATALVVAEAQPSPRDSARIMVEGMRSLGLPDAAIKAALQAQRPKRARAANSNPQGTNLDAEGKERIDTLVRDPKGFQVSAIVLTMLGEKSTKSAQVRSYLETLHQEGTIVKTGAGRSSRWFHYEVPSE
ncbi:MAG: hypothetical protein GY853_05670 [PVC group bacterium]|nr:hypothetical protein [PVC group bacterium]